MQPPQQPQQWGAPPPQPMMGAVYPQGFQRERRWRGNACCCCGECNGQDWASCLCVTFVPCIPFGETVQRASGKGRWPATVFFFFCMTMVGWIVRGGMLAGFDTCAKQFPASAPNPPWTTAQKVQFVFTGGFSGGNGTSPGYNYTAVTSKISNLHSSNATASPPPMTADVAATPAAKAPTATARRLAQATAAATAAASTATTSTTPTATISFSSSDAGVPAPPPVHAFGPYYDYNSCVTSRVSPFSYITIVFFWVIIIVGAGHRLRMRKHFNIKNDCCGDFEDWALWCCCWCCALCQEHRTLVHNRVEDGVWPEQAEVAVIYQAAPAYGGYGAAGGAPPPGYAPLPQGEPPKQV